MNDIYLVIWASMIPLMPYALIRKKYDALAVSVVVFFMLLINVLILLNTPNPDHVILIQVAK